jgi:hypothetical protein
VNQGPNDAVSDSTLNFLVVGDEHSQFVSDLLLRQPALSPQLGDAAPKVVQDPFGRLLHQADVGACEGPSNT